MKKESFQWIDFHSHILPAVDDGSKNVETSVKMLQMLKAQGVRKVVATPHFYPHRGDTVEEFLSRRSRAYEKLMQYYQSDSMPEIALGAEVRIEKRLSEIPLASLCIENTNILLLELPFTDYKSWMYEEVWEIVCANKVLPMFAHLDRYLGWYDIENYNELFTIRDFIVQINAEAIENKKAVSFIGKVVEADYPVVLGTDTHNLNSRSPNFNLIEKLYKKRSYRDLYYHIQECVTELSEDYDL